MQTHENLQREEKIQGSSDRTFGLVFFALLAVAGAWNLWRGRPGAWWWCGASLLFLVPALVYPVVLAPLNRAWTKFGLLLHRIVNPLVMAVMFFGVILPSGLLMRLLGRDPLRLRRDPGAATYWIKRDPPGPAPESMKNQF